MASLIWNSIALKSLNLSINYKGSELLGFTLIGHHFLNEVIASVITYLTGEVPAFWRLYIVTVHLPKMLVGSLHKSIGYKNVITVNVSVTKWCSHLISTYCIWLLHTFFYTNCLPKVTSKYIFYNYLRSDLKYMQLNKHIYSKGNAWLKTVQALSI